MHTVVGKIRTIYLPFLLMGLGLVGGYSLLNWALFVQLRLFALDEEVVNFWLPAALPWLPIYFWLGPRLKALRLANRKADLPSLYCMVAAVTIIVPTVIGQLYLATAMGKMTPLVGIGEIRLSPPTKYYAIDNIAFDKARSSLESRTQFSGKHNEYLNLSVFLVCPLDDPKDARPTDRNLWLGTVYKDQISSGLSEAERTEHFRSFLKTALANYGALDLRTFTYLERVGRTDDARGFRQAIQRNDRHQPAMPDIVLAAHRDAFETRNGNKLAWALGSFGIGATVWLLMLIVAPVDQAEMNRLLRGEKSAEKRPPGLFGIYFPMHRRAFTPWLIDLNAAVFLGMVAAGLGFVSFAGSDLLALGGNFRPAVLNGQIWRLVTSMFIHAGMMHLLGNALSLLLVGVLVEPILGHLRFLTCYFATGVGGGIASIIWHPAIVSVGASGAIFGLWGALIAQMSFGGGTVAIQKMHLTRAALVFLGYNLLFALVAGGIDVADHLGGFVCGLLVGSIFRVFPNQAEGK